MPSFEEKKKLFFFFKGCIFHPNQGVELENFSLRFPILLFKSSAIIKLQHVKQLPAVPQSTNKMSVENEATNEKADGTSLTNRRFGSAPDYKEEQILLASTKFATNMEEITSAVISRGN